MPTTDRTDPMAAHRAAQQIRDLYPAEFVGEGVAECHKGHEVELNDDSEEIAERIADAVTGQFTVHFERRVNEHGVAVRNVVLRGPEEVDPNPPAELLAEVRERLVVRQPEPVGAGA